MNKNPGMFRLNAIILFLSMGFFQTSYATDELLSGLGEIVGVYQGEVRLQSSDGKIDQSFIKQMQLHLDISGDELVLTSSADFLGKNCLSKVGSIRELLKYSNQQDRILRAVFTFDVLKCKKDNRWDSLVVFLMREGESQIALETLLMKRPAGSDFSQLKPEKMSIHGLFTKQSLRLSSYRVREGQSGLESR